MSKQKLMDNYVATGNDFETFNKELKELAKRTTVERPRMKDIELLSQADIKDKDNLCMYRLTPGNIWMSSTAGQRELQFAKMKKDAFERADAGELVKEYENSTSLMMRIDGKIYFTSLDMLGTLGLRVGMSGRTMYEPSLERDVLIAKGLDSDEEVSLIVRNEDGIKKVFAALSKRYSYVPQTVLTDIVEKIKSESGLGEMKCHHWTINHQNAEIYIEFPEKAEKIATTYKKKFKANIVPGLYLAKSDVGEGSITIRSTWRVDSSIIMQGEIKRKHSGEINIDKLLEDAKTNVFEQYKVLPDTLCDLMMIDITDPDWRSTMTTEDFENKNKSTVATVLKKVFKEVDMVGAITKKNEKTLYDLLCDSINPTVDYTAYDIAMMVMTVPQCLTGLPKTYTTPLAKACGRAPYVEYATEEESIVLTA